ncbi:MAG: copper resistance protein CopC [Sphingomonadaceae bacterium]|nr:copper resistance protein CopC [Sphingomonadaceae bacterium]
MFKRTVYVSALAIVALAGGVAQAHPRLVTSSPRANTSVPAVDRVSLTFSERLLAPMSGGDIVMTGRSGAARVPPMKVAGFKPSVGPDGKTLQLVGATRLAKGNYQVKWHAVAADTHRVAGVLAFQVR